jgi:lipopolysaccharide transport system permease protein
MPAIASDTWVIEPWARGIMPRVREFWQYRRLLRFFAVKAIQRLYMSTYLGWIWIFIRPLFPLLVKTMIFGALLAVPTDGVPYFLFLVTASTAWELFASATMWGTRSLDMNRGLLKQLYLPRVILPLAMMAPALLTFVIYMAVLAGAMIYFRITDGVFYLNVGPNLIWAPVALVLALALAFSIALWTSVPAMSVRDVRFTLSYVLGFWVFLTPVMYPMSAMSPQWQRWMLLNPMAPIVEAFKFGVLGVGTVEPWHLGVAALIILVVMSGGFIFFVRAEATAADRV